MRSMSVSLCRWCMLVSCANPVAVLNEAFCMTCMTYSRAGLITALFVYLFILLQNHTHIRNMVYNIDIQ